MTYFTQKELRCYYCYITHFYCSHCGEHFASVLGDTIFAEYEGGAIRIEELAARFGAIYNMSTEAARENLPHLPMEIREADKYMDHCENCVEAFFGNVNCTWISMLPSDDQLRLSASITSPNEELINTSRSGRPRRMSKKLNRKRKPSLLDLL